MNTDAKNKPEKFWVPNSTQIPNLILDDVMPEVSEAVTKVLFVVCRKTFGWQKKWDKLSVAQLTRLTGLSDRAVEGAIAVLVKSSLLLRGELTEFGFEYCLNTDCDIEAALQLLRVKERKPYQRKDKGGEFNSGGGEKISPRNGFGEGDESNSQNPELISPTKQTITKHTVKTKEPGAFARANRAGSPLSKEKEQTPDPRHKLTELRIKEKHRQRFGIECQWDGSEGKVLATLLSANTTWTQQDLDRMVDNVFASAKYEGRPRVWLPNLTKWADGPKGDFNETLRTVRLEASEDATPILEERRKRREVGELKPPPDMDQVAGSRAWEFISDHLHKRISPHGFETWIKPLRVLGVCHRKLYMSIPVPEFHHVTAKFGDFLNEAMRLCTDGGGTMEMILLTPEEQAVYDFTTNVDREREPVAL